MKLVIVEILVVGQQGWRKVEVEKDGAFVVFDDDGHPLHVPKGKEVSRRERSIGPHYISEGDFLSARRGNWRS